MTYRVFQQAQVPLEELRREAALRVRGNEYVSTSVEMPFSGGVKDVLAYAMDEADRLNHSAVGTEHLLLGILRNEHCDAAQALMSRGLVLTTVRRSIADAGEEAPSQPAGRLLHVMIQPSSGHPGLNEGPRSWSRQGVSLKTLIAHLFDIDEMRVDCALPEDGRFDCVVVMPRDCGLDSLKQMARDAVAGYFDVRMTVEETAAGRRVSVVPTR